MWGQEAAPSAAEQAERKKAQGNASFKKRKYKQAAAAYGEAIALQPTNHVLYANRCPHPPSHDPKASALCMPGLVARFLCASGLRWRWLLVGRAAAHSCLGDWEASAKDAAACVEREPSFAKGWFRCDKPKPVHLILVAS